MLHECTALFAPASEERKSVGPQGANHDHTSDSRQEAARVLRRALLRREGGAAAGDGLTTAGARPERPLKTPLTITVSGVFHFRLNRC